MFESWLSPSSWRRARTRSPNAIDGDYVIAGAGVQTGGQQLIIAYKLGATGKLPVTRPVIAPAEAGPVA